MRRIVLLCAIASLAGCREPDRPPLPAEAPADGAALPADAGAPDPRVGPPDATVSADAEGDRRAETEREDEDRSPAPLDARPDTATDARPETGTDAGTKDGRRVDGPPEGGSCGPRWSDTSEACWGCICDRCPAESAACGPGCWAVVKCMVAKKCFTGEVLSETACLIFNCGAQLGGAPKVAEWDSCLIKKGPGFPRRACDETCGLPTHE